MPVNFGHPAECMCDDECGAYMVALRERVKDEIAARIAGATPGSDDERVYRRVLAEIDAQVRQER